MSPKNFFSATCWLKILIFHKVFTSIDLFIGLGSVHEPCVIKISIIDI